MYIRDVEIGKWLKKPKKKEWNNVDVCLSNKIK